MSFEANNSFVYELFDNRTIFAIPRNQRKYVWSEKNWEDLFKDVDCVVKEIFPAHFIGSIVLKNEGRKNGLQYYSVIDGQQRVITLSIFLSCIMLLLKKHQMSEEFRGITRYIQAKNDNDKDQIMVTSDYHTSLELIVAGFINEKEENLKGVSLASIVNKYGIRGKRDKSVINAFTYFLQKITENVNKQPEASKYLLALRDAVVNISFVSIIATSDEDAYTIFEILNARGCALEDHELIKNYIMRYIQPEETRDTAKKIWSEIENNTGSSIRKFIGHYVTHRYARNAKKNESDYRIIQEQNEARNTLGLLHDLLEKSEYYKKLIAPVYAGDESNCSETEYNVFSFFKRRRQEQIRPILIGLIHQHELEKLSDAQYERILTFLYDYYVCYTLIGAESSNKLTSIIYKYAEEIENNFSISIIEDFLNSFKSRLPNKETFTNAFLNIGWSHHGTYHSSSNDKTRVQVVLEILERYKQFNGLCPGEFTIEHILPDSESDQNAIVGNLIPLEEELNSRCNNIEFDPNKTQEYLSEKMKLYSLSNFITARNIAINYSERPFDPQKRTALMANEFYEKILDFSFEECLVKL